MNTRLFFKKATDSDSVAAMGFGKKFKKIFISVLALNYTLFVFFPTDTFLNNKMDFDYTFQSYIFMMAGFTLAISVIISLFVSALPGYFPKFNCAIVGITVASYLQYLFFNSSLALVIGDGSVGNYSLLVESIDLELWIIILFTFPLIHAYKPKLMEKTTNYLPAFFLGIETVAITISLILSGETAFKVNYIFIEGQEQYTVSKNENVIVFVMDAVDNSYMNTILRESPECFEGYEDYTLYTNTCSVYDSTPVSLSQMFAGAEFDNTLSAEEWYDRAWGSEKANIFYERFHEADYQIHAYNFETYNEENLKGKFDNYIFSENQTQDFDIKFDHKKQFLCLFDYGLYKAVPLSFKYLVDTHLYDTKAMIVPGSKMVYYDHDFNDSLKLQLGEGEQNYFIIQHLFGTHPPQKNYIEETKYILAMLNDFNNQLKELGVYDNTTIIITSDHGEHNDDHPEIASFPIFMIKEKNHTGAKMAISNAPVYHEDIMSTLLINADLYQAETDAELFGPSIYDFDDNSVRTRTWYDRGSDPDYPKVSMPGSLSAWRNCNIYYSYTYTGNSDTLRTMVRERNITKIYPMKEIIG